jgi:hypothetical protein
MVLGAGQALLADVIESERGGLGLNKLDAATTVHNLATAVVLESVAEGW